MTRRQINDRDQHEQTAGHGIDDEFERGIDSPRAAPNTDEKIHRHQHDFPKDIKKEKVQRDERAEHPGFQQEHEEKIFLDLILYRPRGENRQRHKKSREQNQKQADAIDADDILDAVAWHPWYALDELHFPFAAIELVEDNQRPNE